MDHNCFCQISVTIDTIVFLTLQIFAIVSEGSCYVHKKTKDHLLFNHAACAGTYRLEIINAAYLVVQHQ